MVSRGGIMLMSLTPRGDGSIDPQEIEIMKGIGTWLNTNGEAIYGTRKWKVSSVSKAPTPNNGFAGINNGSILVPCLPSISKRCLICFNLPI